MEMPSPTPKAIKTTQIRAYVSRRDRHQGTEEEQEEELTLKSLPEIKHWNLLVRKLQ